MFGEAIQDAMNEQMKNEFYAAYQYLSMAAYCESENLPGFAHWMRYAGRSRRRSRSFLMAS
jgi:ferritin